MEQLEQLFSTVLTRHVFLIFGVLSVIGAGAMIFSRNAVHSVIGFLLAMLSIAGAYLCLRAEFLAMAQILVYAGGIVVLFLFVVMLVEMTKYKERKIFQTQTPVALVVVLISAVTFLGVFLKTIFGKSAEVALTLNPELTGDGLNAATHNVQAVSRGLFADYLLPFEILSVILLVALVGAVVLAKSERG
ncbi:NADH-quinone oxidoreductase subunit J family protein [Holophaga foetida]|uniref:NADH-quinone oxidoreductase subunit J family protein n=1 Tax=Holophaga foetida TaxID=35839 RepID=UPI0002472196|nr:NADH-quinone oxidoreductase subunit J [Holophaga foetida]